MRTLLAGLCAIITVMGSAEAARVPAPDPEQGDGRVSAFYTWAEEIPGPPGQMLRTEPLQKQLGLSGAGQQFRILYTSTDADGSSPTVVSGEFFLPKGDQPPPGGWPVLAWAHGTTGLADICAPSWQPHIITEINYLNAWLEQGFAIVATDYQGLGTPGPHPWQMVRPEAHSVLDSVRAVLHGDYHLANRVVISGWSQGASAAFASGGLAPEYASDLDIKGIVTTGIPYWTPDMLKAPPREFISVAVDQPDPRFAYNLYLGLVAQQKNPKIADDRLVSARGKPLLDLARVSCIGGMLFNVNAAELNRWTGLVPSYRDALAEVLPDMMYPTYKLNQPVFLGIGDEDRDTPLSWQQGLTKSACDAGTVIEAHRYRGANHIQAVGRSLKDAIAFVKRVMNGETVEPVCEPTPE